MNNQTGLSQKTKRILTLIVVGFGTVLLFLVSFIFAFSLIVNPVSFAPVSDDETAKENAELKKQIQTLNDEVDVLNATVDKYKASAQSPIIVVSAEPERSSGASSGNGTNVVDADKNKQNNNDDEAANNFSPETVTSTSEETPEDVEPTVTVIDISE